MYSTLNDFQTLSSFFFRFVYFVFSHSLLLHSATFKMSTSAGWDGFMEPTLYVDGDTECSVGDSDGNGRTCLTSTAFSYFYFIRLKLKLKL